ncbi:site-specific integrase [Amycolatopsis sp. NPDC051061]|uniref:tyrosine-type recombinase/integrase n=1 Tax=Amycolatopsis sp. NPDC051061 TaxID=3155042 RepID=UPI0034205C32
MFTAIIRTHGVAGRPVTAGTLQRIQATLRAALNAAVRRGLIDRNPARYVELPRGRRPHAVVWTPPRIVQWHATGERPRVAVWTAAQTATFLREIRDHRLYPLFHLVALLGLRRGEVIGLRWSDVDLEAGYLTVSHQIRQVGATIEVGKPKSEASNRVIALDHTTIALLRRHRDTCRDPLFGEPIGYLFLNGLGQPIRPDALTSLFRLLNTRSGLPPVRLHDLRHGAASLSLAAGNDLKTVQDMLGHASIVLTADTYTSVLPSLARQSAEATARLVLDAARTTGTRLRTPRRRRRAASRRPVTAGRRTGHATTTAARTHDAESTIEPIRKGKWRAVKHALDRTSSTKTYMFAGQSTARAHREPTRDHVEARKIGRHGPPAGRRGCRSSGPPGARTQNLRIKKCGSCWASRYRITRCRGCWGSMISPCAGVMTTPPC